jgi:hypothetical protein
MVPQLLNQVHILNDSWNGNASYSGALKSKAGARIAKAPVVGRVLLGIVEACNDSQPPDGSTNTESDPKLQ